MEPFSGVGDVKDGECGASLCYDLLRVFTDFPRYCNIGRGLPLHGLGTFCYGLVGVRGLAAYRFWPFSDRRKFVALTSRKWWDDGSFRLD